MGCRVLQGNLPDPRIEPVSLASPALANLLVHPRIVSVFLENEFWAQNVYDLSSPNHSRRGAIAYNPVSAEPRCSFLLLSVSWKINVMLSVY